MSFAANVICDSISTVGVRLTTITATYPLIIHPEVLTHRDRERNAGSNRAIPFSKLWNAVISEPFVPIEWGREQSGMHTGEPIPEYLAEYARKRWLDGLAMMASVSSDVHNIGSAYAADPATDKSLMSPGDESIRIHKSIPNRLLNPWQWITVVMTATEWNNFFRLRCHPDAEVHFRKIAGMIRDALAESQPQVLRPGEWHRPFVRGVDEYDLKGWFSDYEINSISTARVARVSYLTHDGEINVSKDFKRFDSLCEGSGFGHWSPHGHVAECQEDPNFRSGPFRGWKQFRKQFANENVEG